MPELTGARVWYDPNTGRLQVTVQDDGHGRDMGVGLKHVTLRFEYGPGSSNECSINRHPRRQPGQDRGADA